MKLFLLAAFVVAAIPCFAAGPTCGEIFSVPSPRRASKWSPELMVSLLQEINARQIPINSKAVQLDPTGQILALLQERGIDGTPNQLFKAITGYYGRWDNALRAAGFQNVVFNLHWTKENVVLSLQEMNALGIPLNARAVLLDPHGQVKNYLTEAQRPGNSAGSLFVTAQKLFGNWDSALRAAGLDPAKIRLSTPHWEQNNVIAMIQELEKAGVSLNVVSLLRDQKSQAQAVIQQQGLGTPGSLLSATDRLFGGWEKALEAAGFDPGVIRLKAPSWKKTQIISVIQSLATQGVALNYKYIVEDPQGLVKKQLHSLRMAGSPASFALAATAKFGSWDQALREAGLNPILVRKYVTAWTQESLLSVIKSLHESQLQINSTNIRNDPFGEIAKHLLEVAKTGGSSGQLVQAATRLFGSWDQALIAANINPDTVRLHGTTPYKLLSDWMKEERQSGLGALHEQSVIQYQSGKDGEVVREVIDETSNVELAYIERENREAMDRAIDQFNVTEKILLEKVLEVIENEGLPDITGTTLTRALTDKLFPLASAADKKQVDDQLQEMFMNLSRNQELRDALFGNN